MFIRPPLRRVTEQQPAPLSTIATLDSALVWIQQL